VRTILPGDRHAATEGLHHLVEGRALEIRSVRAESAEMAQVMMRGFTALRCS
jgi:hypothetical protein